MFFLTSTKHCLTENGRQEGVQEKSYYLNKGRNRLGPSPGDDEEDYSVWLISRCPLFTRDRVYTSTGFEKGTGRRAPGPATSPRCLVSQRSAQMPRYLAQWNHNRNAARRFAVD